MLIVHVFRPVGQALFGFVFQDLLGDAFQLDIWQRSIAKRFV